MEKKKASPKQVEARKRFVSNVKEAKKIRDKDPNIKMSKAVQMAYARDRPREELRKTRNR